MDHPIQAPFDPFQLTRPDRSLLRYYVICSICTGPLFPIVFLPLFFKYETLRYKFDADGVSMTWGILFRRETYLTYRRIQDIHVTRNIIQRWMGLANVAIQTAAGSSTAEATVEGVLQFDALRDFLYQRMRGAKGDTVTPPGAVEAPDESLVLLRDIRDALAKVADRSGGVP